MHQRKRFPELHRVLVEQLGFLRHSAGWRAFTPECVACIELQWSNGKERHALNLGVHYDFMPRPVAWTDIREPNCVLRARLPVGERERWWLQSEEAEMIAELLRSGRAWIQTYRDPQKAFADLSYRLADDGRCETDVPLAGPVAMAVAYLLARLGRAQEARSVGLHALTSSRSGVRIAGRRFLEGYRFP